MITLTRKVNESTLINMAIYPTTAIIAIYMPEECGIPTNVS